MAHGGTRKNSGRPSLTEDQKQSRIDEKSSTISKEFVFPALCQAFKAEPGKYKDRYLTVELSKFDIQRAYGLSGLQIWCRYFKQDKIGGRNKAGVGYKTRWCLHLGSYDVAKLLVESLGHTIKDLPNPGFPPKALTERLEALDAKKKAREAKKVSDIVASLK